MQRQPVISVRKVAVSEQAVEEEDDRIAVEEPLEIQVRSGKQHRSLGITMRTPGNDSELSLGLLYSEGLIAARSDVRGVTQVEPNLVVVELTTAIPEQPWRATQYRSTACGICGSDVIDQVFRSVRHQLPPILLTPDVVRTAVAAAAHYQPLFQATGGTHAASLFTAHAQHIATFEDVGRHNAVDKLIGFMFQRGNIPNTEPLLLVLSGRAGFELIHKAVRAGIPAVCAIGAPSSLAVHLAQEAGLLLIAFCRRNRFNIYAGGERCSIQGAESGKER